MRASLHCNHLTTTAITPRPSLVAFRNQKRAKVVASARQKSAVSASIISVLKDELKFERESYRLDEVLLTDPPNGFEMKNEAGIKMLYLFKIMNNEQIVIEVDLELQMRNEELADIDAEDAESDDQEQDDEPVSFTVNISKGSRALSFECESDGQYLIINKLSSLSQEDEGLGYTGPNFSSLDDTLQQAFLDYLEERGITPALGAYVLALTNDKMASEYQAWLEAVKNFVAE